MLRFYKSLIVLFCLAFALPACAELQLGAELAKQSRRTAAGGIYKVGTPYKIDGDWYYPRENNKYDNVGIASWYGSKFQGRRTANGEIFDMNLLTAAHPTLPMPVLARVTNLANGRALTVRINDRGPFKKNREIDLSRRAAEILGFKENGTAKVRVQYLGKAALYNSRGQLISGQEPESFVIKKPVTPQSTRYVKSSPVGAVEARDLNGKAIPQRKSALAKKNFYVQVGVFSQKQYADNLNNKLDGIGNIRTTSVIADGREFYRVRIGPLNSRLDANIMVDDVLERGHQDAIILEE